METAACAAVFLSTELIQCGILFAVQDRVVQPTGVALLPCLHAAHTILCRTAQFLSHLITTKERIGGVHDGNSCTGGNVFVHQALHDEFRVRHCDLSRADKGHIVAAKNQRSYGEKAPPLRIVSEGELPLVCSDVPDDLLHECGKRDDGLTANRTGHILSQGQRAAVLKFASHVVAVDVDDGDVILRSPLSEL